MNKPHLSEKELQQFVLQPEADPSLAAHINSCAICSASAANYKAMFAALGTLEKPVFDFDTEKLIMAQLPVAKRRFPWVAVLTGLIAVLIFTVTLLTMGSFLAELFRGIPAIMLDIIIVSAAAIIVFQCREILVPYRKKMRLLNSF